MGLQSDVKVAGNHAKAIGESAKNLWHDELTAIDNVTTLSANTNIKSMYTDEQSVTKLVIHDIEQEERNLALIAEEFKNVDILLGSMLEKL